NTRAPGAGFGALATVTTAGAAVSVSVAVLLAGLESGVPAGLVTVAALTRSPLKSAGTGIVSANVTEAPAGRLTGTFAIARLPLAAPHTPPPVAAPQVHVALVMPAGSGSSTVAPATPNGPRLLTTML